MTPDETDEKPNPVAYPLPPNTVDCDIHNRLGSLETLFPYLADHWRDYVSESAFIGPDANDYPPGYVADKSAGTALIDVQEQVLDAWNLGMGILTCAYWVSSVHNEDLADALATAINQWQIDVWLGPEPRLRASIAVPSQNPALAARQIDRFGAHPGYVQVLLPVRSQAPYGNRRYAPIYEAAIRHDLPVGLHYGGAPGHPSTSAGWPSTYAEEYAGMAQVFQSQLLSLVSEGTFDSFPQLRVALIEGGFTWLPAFMWRFDKEWKGLRHNTPWVKRLPSTYIREHIRLTLQPVDAPPYATHLQQILEQMESDELLMFASDYPHLHDRQQEQALFQNLSDSTLSMITAENAKAFYRL